MYGIKRGLFSNEAGVGSAPNASAAADVSHPVKQGLVQILSVFIDTILVCSATAFMCMCSGIEPSAELSGAPYIQAAMKSTMGGFGPIFITVAMLLFAFTTLLGNLYYVNQALSHIIGHVPGKKLMYSYYVIASLVIFVGAGLSADLLWTSGFETKVKSIFEQLPATLQRHEKKFRLQDIQSSARFREYETSFFWLEESQVVNICWGATEPSLGLRMKMDTQQLKCYMADTGLLISLAFDEKTIVGEEIYKKLLLDKLEINKGMLVENIVAQMLRASGHRLYFYSQYSNVADDRMEIDFLIQKPTISNRHNISPIEVKSSTRYTLTSLGKFMKKYNTQLYQPYVIHYQDLKSEGGIVFLPIYMTIFL